MSPKKPNSAPEPAFQGSLFEEQVISNGSTDPATYEATQVFIPVSEGVFPEAEKPKTEYDFSVPATTEAVHKENLRRKHSKEQRGVHSALDPETGLYDINKVAPGIVLPDYGIVRHGNLNEAREFAVALNRKLSEKRSRPS